MNTGRDTCNGSCERTGCDCIEAAHAATYIGSDESGPMHRLTWRDRFGMAIPLLCVAVAVALMAAAARLS